MADTAEEIRRFTVSNKPGGFVFRGGKIYIMRWEVDYMAVYHYSGEHIRDHMSIIDCYTMETRGGRFYLPHLATGGDGIRIRHYDGSVIRNISLTYIPRIMRLRNGRYWITKHGGANLYEHHYDGSEIQNYTVGDIFAGVEIRGGKIYALYADVGNIGILNKGGEEIEVRGASIQHTTMRFRGGRVFIADYDNSYLRIVNYAYFNIL